MPTDLPNDNRDVFMSFTVLNTAVLSDLSSSFDSVSALSALLLFRSVIVVFMSFTVLSTVVLSALLFNLFWVSAKIVCYSCA